MERRSGSVSSLLNKAKSFSDLPSHEDAPDIITESLQPLAEETVGDPQPDVSLGNGAFLGRFVPDKKGELLLHLHLDSCQNHTQTTLMMVKCRSVCVLEIATGMWCK